MAEIIKLKFGCGKLSNEYTGFHATDESSAQNIISDGFDIKKTKKRDNHWLGTGIYFFPHYADAQSWAKETPYIAKSPAILKCGISVLDDKVLDLDNPFFMNMFQEYFDEILDVLTKAGKSLTFKTDKHAMHYGLDIYKEDKNIHFIKYTFHHHRTKRVLKYAFNPVTYGYNEVQYCVSDESCININEQLELGGAVC